MRRSLALLLIGCSGAAWACGRSGLPALDEAGNVRIPTPVTHFPDGAPTPEPMDDEGDGRDGDLDLTTTTTVPQDECRVVIGTTSGQIVVADATDLTEGTRLLVLQVRGGGFRTSGDQDDIVATDPTTAGTWQVSEVKNVTSIAGQFHLALFPAPKVAFASDASGLRAQACILRQYGAVTIASGVELEAQPWDGNRGGVVGFFATGTVTLAGTISASGQGFRGGALRADADVANITAADTDFLSPAGSGGGKGEGLDGTSFERSGRGNVANGGGGGNGKNAGGGGGGNGGDGGIGGLQDSAAGVNLATRGFGGAAVSIPLAQRISFGGGGGAGHQDDSNGGAGGRGGGLVFVVATAMAGGGVLSADGEDGEPGGNASRDGAGGGGAGGAVFLRARSDLTDTLAWTVRARGGDGGDIGGDLNRFFGPGGGGGGGRIAVTAPSGAFSTDVARGASGTLSDGVSDHGSDPGDPGAVD